MALIEMDLMGGGTGSIIDFANPENVKGTSTANNNINIIFTSKPDMATVCWIRNSAILGWHFIIDLVNQKGYAQYVRNSDTIIIDYYELSSDEITFTDTGFILPVLRDMDGANGIYNAWGFKYI